MANWEQSDSLKFPSLFLPMLKYVICSVHWCSRAGCGRLWFYTSTVQGIGGRDKQCLYNNSVCYMALSASMQWCGCRSCSSSAGRGKGGWLIGSNWRISMDIWLWMSESVATSSPKQHQYKECFQLVSENSACSTRSLNARLCCNIQYFNIRTTLCVLVILLKSESHLWVKVLLTSRAPE